MMPLSRSKSPLPPIHDLLQTLFHGIQAAAHTRHAQHCPAHAAHGGGNGVEFGRHAFQFGLQFAHPGRIGGGCLFQFPFSQRAACLQFGIGLFDLSQLRARLVGFNAQNRLGFGRLFHFLRRLCGFFGFVRQPADVFRARYVRLDFYACLDFRHLSNPV